jgi:RNA polymerase sigma factor (sigma-70 family)
MATAAHPTDATDDDLMQAFAAGDLRAFEQLYARHRSALFRFVRRLLGQSLAAQADEVFQDTWLRVVDARERWSPQGAMFRTWLFTLAHHRAVDCLRKSGRELSLDEGDNDNEPWQPEGEAWSAWPAAHTGAGPQDLVFWRAAGQRLVDCIEQLPTAQKSVFLLHHEDGLALDELARGLQLGFETAKSRLRYAMSKLRTCMGAYLPAPGAEDAR